MALIVDAISNSGAKTSVSSITVPHVCTGNNLVLVVCVGTGNVSQAVTGVTYDGVAFTKIDSCFTTSEVTRSEMWYLKNPSTGTHNIVVTLAGTATRAGVGAISFISSDQYNPINISSVVSSEAGTPSTSVTTTSVNTYLVDSLYHGDTGSSPNGSQTQICKFDISGQDSYGASYKALAAAGVGTMAWTNAGHYSHVVAAVQEGHGKGYII